MPRPAHSTISPRARLRHSQRKRTARHYLLAIGVILIAANASLFGFALGEHCPWNLLGGYLLGQGLATIMLLGGIWRRIGWARYVLATVLFSTIAVAALCTMTMMSKPEFQHGPSLIPLSLGIALMIGAVTWLIRSRRIQYLATPPGSGG